MKFRLYRFKAYVLFVAMCLTVSSCELFDLDINKDPNNPTEASLELLLANAQLEGVRTFSGTLNDGTMGFVGLVSANDDHNLTFSTWNAHWNNLYSGALADLNKIIVAAEAQGNNPHYLGVAQVMKAYYFSLMVDLWGSVPYFDAFNGETGSKAPQFDDEKAIYDDLISLCDKAVANFALTSPVGVKGDLIYNGSIAKWRKAAKSMKLRLYLNARAAYADANTQIQTLITAGDLIMVPGDDFTLKFSSLQNPDDRHPMYQAGYAGGEAAYSYYGHQFMAEMLAARDPRTPYYFKRQTSTVLDPADPTQKQTIPCSQRTDCQYNYFPLSPTVTNMVFGVAPGDLSSDEAAFLAGFFGRDRSDPSGVPNDNPIRTTVGAYPAGGLIDDEIESGAITNLGTGDGIFPMLTSWMMKFYLMEAMISLNVTVPSHTVETLLASALDDQISRVISVGNASDPEGAGNVLAGDTDWPLDYETKADFIADVVADYTAAAGSQKLNFVLKQAWFANYGNGYEIYNAFRRTDGLPNTLQAPLQHPRQFALRLPYTQDEINSNPNVPSKVYDKREDRLFWDPTGYQF